ncbi:solute carrier organic anion transporter family member 4C1-like [Carcharodon carcharias]|uniref:solute carrier organic anion transporter family member 4C1-like n=1 Tax=Carcharodon carcharias TaxID=13397 RepID=UPI001B7EEB58|nr:solute carrier organic anion transporter family member 4C1-like [Carcharodon carcharias]
MDKGVDNPAFITDDKLNVRQNSNSKPEKIETSEQEFEEGPCGWGTFTPNCLQCCNNPEGYLAFYSLLGVIQGTLVNGLVNINITTIEKRYNLNSLTTGLISAGYDISFSILCLFVSYHGQKGHKPRWLAFSAFMLGLGSLVFCLPHFTGGLYNYGAQITDTCVVPHNNASTPACTPSATTKSSTFVFVFLLGQLLHGVGGTPLYTLGTAHIDDSVSNEKSSLYIGIGSGMSVLGPAFGYVIGGQFLDIYIDINTISKIPLMPDDPRWLGAWWIGFLLCWILAWCLVIPLSCFPKHLPGTAEVQLQKVSQAHSYKGGIVLTQHHFGKSFKDFYSVLLMLLRNPVFMALVIAGTTESLVITGFVTFMPKYIENQFGLTASLAAILGGAVLIPGAFIGQIIGGVIISKLRLQCRNVLKMAAATCTASLLCALVFIFAQCSNQPFAGVNQDYNHSSTAEKFELLALCNEECHCIRSHYNPVCGVDNVQYFSACYAGCTNTSVTGDTEVYHSCSCIPHVENKFNAREGKCGPTCTKMPIFMGFFLLSVIFTFMTSTPITTSVLRCVPDSQRSFSLGIQWLFVRILGTIPGPILFGTVIDVSCVLWNKDNCGHKGACWTYDNPKMANLITVIGTSSKLISIVAIIAAFFLYRPPQVAEVTEQMADGPASQWGFNTDDQD